jgi:alkanesulfonate monooxygenase SsuD/methylene tetrahydromethanopterin reductase-like flavin-dependent oxidoreductase (luciferase family)
MPNSLRERLSFSIDNHIEATYGTRNIIEVIKEAEASGVYHVWLPQIGPLDTLTMFTAAALQTQSITLGVGVVPIPTRHPFVLAQQALAFDEIAPRRLRLGIGTSNKIIMEDLYGIPMQKKPISYLKEYVTVLRSALEKGAFDYQGEFFQVHSSSDRTTTRIPLIISALGERAFEAAGEIADGALPWLAPLPYLQSTALAAMKRGAASQHRPKPLLIAGVLVALSEDRQAVQDEVVKYMGIHFELPYYIRMFAAAGVPVTPDGMGREALLETLVVQGSAENVALRLRQLLDTELDEINMTLVPIKDESKERAQLFRLIEQF